MKKLWIVVAALLMCIVPFSACGGENQSDDAADMALSDDIINNPQIHPHREQTIDRRGMPGGVNPILPLWEHVPDPEPRVFEYPDGIFRAYVIGSHDLRFDSYCGPDIRVWSACVSNLTEWRDEGPVFTYQAPNGLWDVMYAPDMVEVRHRDGRREYFLFPHSRGPGREAMVASAPSPTGPFTILNLNEAGTHTLPGSIMGFDPHVFIEQIDDPNDPDYEIGFRAFGFWGFQRSWAAELDQSTMWSVRPGTQVVDRFIPSSYRFGEIRDPVGTAFPHVFEYEDLTQFNFFEAKAMRQIGNKFILTFSGFSGPDYGLSSTNSSLRYAFGDTPLGPWRMGGVLVDSRAPMPNQHGTALEITGTAHNTHGALQKINDQWYVFYHRAPRGFGYARQTMVAPVTIDWDEKPVSEGGRVTIRMHDPFAENGIWTARGGDYEFTGIQVTSEGFHIFGLPPYRFYSAGIASYMSRPGSLQNNWDIWDNHMPLTNVQNGDRIGYKHFGFGGLDEYTSGLIPFEGTAPGNNTHFNLWLTPRTNSAFTINIWLDGPWDNEIWRGTRIGQIEVPAGSVQEATRFTVDVSNVVDHLDRKHGIFLVAQSTASGALFDLLGLGFSADHIDIKRPIAPTANLYVDGEAIDVPREPVRSTMENGITGYDLFETVIYLPRDTTHVSEISASVSDAAVDVTILRQPTETFDAGYVAFDYNGVVKTYRVVFEPAPTRGPPLEFIIATRNPTFEGTARVMHGDFIGGIDPIGTLHEGVASTEPGAVSFAANVFGEGLFEMQVQYMVHGGAASHIWQINGGDGIIFEYPQPGMAHSLFSEPVPLNFGNNIFRIQYNSGIAELRSVVFRRILE